MEDKEEQARKVERMLKDRIITLFTPIDDDVANVMLAQLLYLLDSDGRAPVYLYINSPGGSVSASFAILDAMDDADAPIYTTCLGFAAGTAALIVAHGAKGGRFALPHARIKLTSTKRYKAGAVAPQDEEVRRVDQLVVGRLARDTGRPEAQVRADLARERELDAYEAREYGLIDEIVKG